ncbi:MAG: hypothetical protein ABIO70_07580 [Pseudomonadota bacterium]
MDCDNGHTFSGDYACECFEQSFSPVPSFVTFESPDICDVALAGASNRALEGCGWDLVEE